MHVMRGVCAFFSFSFLLLPFFWFSRRGRSAKSGRKKKSIKEKGGVVGGLVLVISLVILSYLFFVSFRFGWSDVWFLVSDFFFVFLWSHFVRGGGERERRRRGGRRVWVWVYV